VVAAVVFHGIDASINLSSFERPVAYWGGINYCLWRFGFFSPDVGKSSEIEFKIILRNGNVKKFTTSEGFDFFTGNRESLIRFYAFRIEAAEESVLQGLCARSVVVHVLNELGAGEDVSTVEYTVRNIRYPTMEGFRAGKPVETTDSYSTTFVLNGNGDANSKPAF
jgi:hypothetical protein